MARTHYQVLGIERDASSVEIAAAFRERMIEFKERTYAGADKEEDVREAYRVLSNGTTRDGYDETLPAMRVKAPSQSGVPGWMKWALPFVLVALVLGWMRWSKPKEPVMTVKTVTRVAAEDDDPTRPAPVTIPDPVPGNAFLPPAPAAATPTSAVGGSAESVFASVSPSVARILARDAGGQPVSQGSGVVIGTGTLITNCHVTQGASEISVKVGNEEYRGSLAGEDLEHDLCRISVTGLNAPPVTLSSINALRTGQRVFAIGAPQGLELTISEGIVSALREFPGGKVIQTSAPISPGSSGGGLFDDTGKLVGVVTFQHKFGQNLNFAVPADWISR